ncbi:hypothetical protein A3Q56_01403 [Intoshia linei]|uniref:CH-like domain-containing protein n=1 Tax=Intoshia linei TaxID=1819745 RepID=A0A177BB04_9BILA|nr:hypothetical protein A3Q56_01403 [Intoshia linei]
MANSQHMDTDTLEELYQWVDKIPLSRPKKDIRRDFSDGVMTAEVVYFFNQNIIDMHSYSPAVNSERKKNNWNLLNRFGQHVLLLSEIIKHFIPRFVDSHNYVPSGSLSRKRMNMTIINKKVFSKLGFMLADDVISNIINSQPWAIEQVLLLLRKKIESFMFEQKKTLEEKTVRDEYASKQVAKTNKFNRNNKFQV